MCEFSGILRVMAHNRNGYHKCILEHAVLRLRESIFSEAKGTHQMSHQLHIHSHAVANHLRPGRCGDRGRGPTGGLPRLATGLGAGSLEATNGREHRPRHATPKLQTSGWWDFKVGLHQIIVLYELFILKVWEFNQCT